MYLSIRYKCSTKSAFYVLRQIVRNKSDTFKSNLFVESLKICFCFKNISFVSHQVSRDTCHSDLSQIIRLTVARIKP